MLTTQYILLFRPLKRPFWLALVYAWLTTQKGLQQPRRTVWLPPNLDIAFLPSALLLRKIGADPSNARRMRAVACRAFQTFGNGNNPCGKVTLSPLFVSISSKGHDYFGLSARDGMPVEADFIS
jgi:hypothetical protein